MDIKIISFLEEERIVFNNSKVNFKCLEQGGIKHYYKIDNSKIEIIYLDKSKVDYIEEIFNYLNIKPTIKNIILLEDNAFIDKYIKNKLIKNNCIIISKDKMQEYFILNEKIKILGLEKYGVIDISLILFGLLKNEELDFSLNIDTIILGREKDNLIGNLVLSILKRLSYINKAKELNLFLYLRNEFNLQDLTFIEDPLKEYINNKVCLNIKQRNSEIIDNELYFSLIKMN